MGRILAKGIRAYLFLTLGVFVSVAPAQQSRKAARSAEQQPAGDWSLHGRDYSETYYSPLNQINDSNVGKLGLAWFHDGDAPFGQLEATPVVANGTIYASLTWSVIVAVDATTGKLKWRWDPEIPRQQFKLDANGVRIRVGPSFCCGAVNRGVALYQGKVYAGLLDGSLAALDAATGKVVWRVQTTNKEDDYSITGAPRIIKGKVIVGNSGAEYGVRGYITAYDAQTGKKIWRFYTVPGDPSAPFESKALELAAKTWSGPYWKFGAGGTAWDGMAYDAEADLLYIGTGNGSPWPRSLRSPGGGDNLYLACILAIRPDTGEYVWHYQTTPADNWDYAATQPLILTELNIGGRKRKVIMQAPKNGFFYVLDRITGEFISAQPFARVTWAKGVDPKTGRPIETPEANYGAEAVTLSPGSDGAHNWHSMSWNPDTGLVYIPGQETSGVFAVDMNFQYQLGRLNMGRKRSAPRSSPVEAAAPTGPQATNDMVVGLGRQQEGGFLVAWDPVTQKERWRIRSSVPGVSGGTVTTRGNLVFHGGSDGMFRAYSGDKGEKLWEVQLAPGFANPITYMLNGKQYVSVLTGRGGMQSPGRMYTFVLGGETPLPSMEPPATAKPVISTNSQRPATAQLVEQVAALAELPDAPGKDLVVRVCATCHPASSITRNRMPGEAWRQTVADMVRRGAQATPAELTQIIDYLTKNLGTAPPVAPAKQ